MSIHLGELILRFQSFFAFLLFFTDFKNRGHMMKLYFMGNLRLNLLDVIFYDYLMP
ncbi:hypothetical protein Bca101_017564 [Brassica carinata]